MDFGGRRRTWANCNSNCNWTPREHQIVTLGSALRSMNVVLARYPRGMDLEGILRDAAVFGLAVGVVAMALYLLWQASTHLLKPPVVVAAATTAVEFGFCLPS